LEDAYLWGEYWGESAGARNRFAEPEFEDGSGGFSPPPGGLNEITHRPESASLNARERASSAAVMVWLNMTTREIIVSESTQHPNSAWVVKQTEEFLNQTLSREHKPDIVMHDRDTKFSKEFVAKLKEHGVRNNKLPKASPNLNGRCERAIFTLKEECLRKFIIFGKRHLDHLLAEFTDYYNNVRSSMVRDHLPPVRSEEPEEVKTIKLEQVEVKEYVGGLVKGFRRKAA
jgi:putative transposase